MTKMNKVTDAGLGPLSLNALIGLSGAKEENMTNNLIIFSFKGLQLGLGFNSIGIVLAYHAQDPRFI